MPSTTSVAVSSCPHPARRTRELRCHMGEMTPGSALRAQEAGLPGALLPAVLGGRVGHHSPTHTPRTPAPGRATGR
ncbi:hypothetical protein [Streptomyces sp. NPDC008150]|uniref:hypothetical protein n=1 Tax=Streptomyces sp. NPDC008150 TaxID=3364816 RepID=UPI0036E1D626